MENAPQVHRDQRAAHAGRYTPRYLQLITTLAMLQILRYQNLMTHKMSAMEGQQTHSELNLRNSV